MKVTEEWRAVVGYEGVYEVSSFGRVRSLPRTITLSPRSDGRRGSTQRIQGRVLRPNLTGSTKSYYYVILSKDAAQRSRPVHQLVLEAFVGPRPDGLVACHNNGKSTDNRPENLRWDTHDANIADKQIHGTARKYPGERHGYINTYTYHGCRCDECRHANYLAGKAWRERTGYSRAKKSDQAS